MLSDPFLPLLAEDALTIARDAQPEQVIENGRIIRFASLAAAAASVLVWLMFWGPGVFGYGTALFWGSFPKEQTKPFYSITVEPGSKTIRRKTDLMVSAHITGFSASKATCSGALCQRGQVGRSSHAAASGRLRIRLPVCRSSGRR